MSGLKVTRIGPGAALRQGLSVGGTATGDDVDWETSPFDVGAVALDDLADVNAPAPNDQDVLTWDDGAGEWVAAPGGSEASGHFYAGWDGGLSNLVAGHSQDIIAPHDGTLTAWTILADAAGSAEVDILKAVYTGFDSSLSSIVAVAPPTLATDIKAQSSSLTGWTLAVTAGDVLRFTLSTVSGLRRLLLVLDYSRP